MKPFDVSQFKFNIGDSVRYATWLKQYDDYLGRVLERCYSEHAHGAGIRYLVKWMSPDGDPSAESMWVKDNELEPYKK